MRDRSVRFRRRALVVLLGTLVPASALEAQTADDAETGIGVALDVRLGFLITDSDGHPDRPLVGLDGRLRLRRARVGGGPGFDVTGGVTIGFAEFFAEVQSESIRLTGGIEVPWAVASRGLGRNPIEIVPVVQAGFLDSNGGDERDGLVARVALGIRIPVGDGPLYLTFEPFGLTHLPAPDEPHEGDSRWAYEMGLLRVGWSF